MFRNFGGLAFKNFRSCERDIRENAEREGFSSEAEKLLIFVLILNNRFCLKSL